MWKYKTWKFRLMTGLQRREYGRRIIGHAYHYLSNPKNPNAPFGFDIAPFNSTDALRLLWETIHKNGNFYKNGEYLTKWDGFEDKVRNIPWLISHRFRIIWKAITLSDDVGFLEQ